MFFVLKPRPWLYYVIVFFGTQLVTVAHVALVQESDAVAAVSQSMLTIVNHFAASDCTKLPLGVPGASDKSRQACAWVRQQAC